MVHKAAIEYLARTVPSAMNNHYAKTPVKTVDGRIPDVIVTNSEGRITRLYEVEVVSKQSPKKFGCLKRILVVALADNSWDEVQVIAGEKYTACDVVRIKHKADVQQRRLKSLNKRMGSKLSLVREKKRVDEGWE